MGSNPTTRSPLSLAYLPPIYILPSHLSSDELRSTEDALLERGGQLTGDAKKAQIFLGRISQKKRAAFDLRARGVWTEEVQEVGHEPVKKRRKLNVRPGGATAASSSSPVEVVVSETESSSRASSASPDSEANAPELKSGDVIALRLEWLHDSIRRHKILPFQSYTIYAAKTIPKPAGETSPPPLKDGVTYIKAIPESSTPTKTATTILSRAQAEAPQKGPAYAPRRRFNQSSNSTPTLTHPPKPPKLHRTTTSEFENLDSRALPEPPDWVKSHQLYACCRSSPLYSSNAAFIGQLHKIKEARQLTLDEIGVRAYSTSIASIAAYPYKLQSGAEVLRLPGCEQKIASLWTEWFESEENDSSRSLEVVKRLDADEDLKHLKLFYEIWGVGADTARKFYFDRGWKDIDDIVEFGWNTLNRVQQIGVKFYDEFRVKIPKTEVEHIAATIHRHARSCRGIPESDWDTDRDMVCVIVGGYRRGKEESGDVDVILSHRDEDVTKDLVIEVVASLEQEGWITHTLTLNTTTSDRNQQTLPYRGEGHGHGFDSLDKALCVWQDPNFDSSVDKNNPNIHRRVDIITSAWRTVGCAVLGWSGATTFQRDIRRWTKRQKGWKFDSSGVRDRATGVVLDLESPKKEGDGDTWLDREKRLMTGLGIGWRPAGERCTG